MLGIAILAIGYIFSQFFRSFLAVLDQTLALSLGMDETQLAYASGAWFLAFALSQFPVGYCLDNYGPRRTAGVVFMVFCGAGAALFAAAWAPWVIIVSMALVGVGCSPALMAPMYIFVRNFSPERFAVLVSLFIGVGLLGNIASSAPLAAAVEWFGWRETAVALAVLCVGIGLAMLVVVKDPEKLNTRLDGQGGFLQVLRIRKLWPIFPMIFAGYVVTAGLRGSWVGPIHTELYNYSTLETGGAVFVLSVMLVIGTLLYGPMDRLLRSRKIVVVGGNIGVASLCAFLWYTIPSEPLVMTAIISLIGMLGASYAVQMAHGNSFIPAQLAGRGVTMLNFCSIGGAGICQWLSGPVIQAFSIGDDAISKYQVLFGFYAVITIVALAMYMFSTDAKPQTVQASA